MSTFYQNEHWRYINQYIYKKPTFNINIFWNNYFWVVKQKTKFWLSLNWYQVLWIELPDINDFWLINTNLERIRRDFSKSWWDMFFQLWFINNVYKCKSSDLKDEDTLNVIKQNYNDVFNSFKENTWLIKSCRENMPPANVIVDIWISNDEIFAKLSKNTKAQVKKWKSKWLEFWIIKKSELEDFYLIWYWTSSWKWFSIPDKSLYYNLCDYIIDNDIWNIFVARIDWKIVAGSLVIFNPETKVVYYLYWAADRNSWNIWQHQYLKYNLFIWAKENGYLYIDLLWVAPAWLETHSLSSVSKFKNSLWWDYINYLWNFDLVFNKKFYKFYSSIKS